MSDYKNIDDFDLMMKSILDEAREEVPERVWEGVSAGLDKAARRKTVVLWWRRAAAGAAVAAAVVMGVFLMHDNGDELLPHDVFAVVEPDEEVVPKEDADVDVDDVDTYTLLAKVEEAAGTNSLISEESVAGSAAEMIEMMENAVTEEDIVGTTGEKAVRTERKDVSTEYFPEDWGEDEGRKSRNVSLVLSGIAGTNNALSQNRLNPMKRPEASAAPKETGLEETSVRSSYGVPVSVGAGVKFDLNKRWSIGVGLNYTHLSRLFYGKYTKVNANGNIESITSSDIRNRQHYIGIPVNAFYNVINNDKVNFYAYAGGTVERCISDSYSLLNTSIRHKGEISGVQLSANAGIGVEFMLGKHLGLYIDPSLRYYFDNGQPKSIRTVQPLMLGFEMGLRARL